MAVLVPSMSAAIPQLSNHMTDAHGQPGSPDTPLSKHESGILAGPTSKKPKLSLQTSSLGSTYGSLTRGIAANQQATYTPTTTNTLANTWDLSYRPSPVPRTESPKPAQLSRTQTQTQTQQDRQPYSLSLPFGVRSILKNSPLPRRASSVSASPRDSRRKAFFPQPKKVVFRRNLEDVIQNSQYIAKHSEISSSEDEGSSSSEEPSTLKAKSEVTVSPCSSPPNRKRKDRRDSGICVDTNSSTGDKQSVQNADSAEARPVENCKRRKWQWIVPSSDKSALEDDDQSSTNQSPNNTFESSPDQTAEDDHPTTIILKTPQPKEYRKQPKAFSPPDEGGSIDSPNKPS